MSRQQVKKTLTTAERKEIMEILENRFKKNMARHKGLEWTDVQQRLEAAPEKLWSLYQMEQTGGEPDIVAIKKDGTLTFYDCAAESPKGRRSICYDREALDARKEHKPADSAMEMAEEMGIEMLDESQYRALQQLGKFDEKTSSWIKTPDAIRKKGGAIFADRRYDHVFVYHNGASSYYAARGFRGALTI